MITRVRGPSRGGPLAAAVDPPVEDQSDLVGAAEVEVVADDLFEEDPPAHGLVEHLGQGELRLQDREVVAVPGGAVGWAERVGQDRQPLAQQGIDLLRTQAVTDRLQRGRVIDRGERVVHRLVGDAGLGCLPLSPVVAVQAQPGVVGKVRAELQEERSEVLIDAGEVGRWRGAFRPFSSAPLPNPACEFPRTGLSSD